MLTKIFYAAFLIYTTRKSAIDLIYCSLAQNNLL